MACFTVPAATGLITTVLRKKFPQEMHVDWLNKMIFGGTIALGIEHIAHEEIVFWPPFLTAMSSPEATGEMLKEMLLVGVPMTLAIIMAWIALVFVYEKVLALNAISAKY